MNLVEIYFVNSVKDRPDCDTKHYLFLSNDSFENGSCLICDKYTNMMRVFAFTKLSDAEVKKVLNARKDIKYLVKSEVLTPDHSAYSIYSVKAFDNNDLRRYIKPGYLVETRGGKKYLACKRDNEIELIGSKGYMHLSSYGKDLTLPDEGNSLYDIMKIYRVEYGFGFEGFNNKDLCKIIIWERKKAIHISIDELLKALNIRSDIELFIDNIKIQ